MKQKNPQSTDDTTTSTQATAVTDSSVTNLDCNDKHCDIKNMKTLDGKEVIENYKPENPISIPYLE
ncbi:hypothetical protein KA013_01230 [Patescibacteria group bacterium]|nr:hypothetical protein [Patescibacteria group bacterium]